MFCVNLEFKKIKIEQLILRKENTNKKVVTDHLNEFLRINLMERIFSGQSTFTVINRIKLDLLHKKEFDSKFFLGTEEFLRDWLVDLPAMTTLCLKKVNLYDNWLKLKKSTFQSLICLQKLDLSDNSIEELDPDMFVCNKSLRILNLSRNKIVSFTNDVFKNVRKRKIEKERNNSRRLAPTIFQSLVDLKELNLSNNQILDLDSDIFSCNKNLIKLNISSNGLNELKKGLFRNLFSLEDLNLCHNSIMHLTECSFQNLVNLKRLDLSNNHITDLPVKLFCGLVCLESVDLTHNSCLGKSLEDPDVERLDIDKNKIKFVVYNNDNVSYNGWSSRRCWRCVDSRQCRRCMNR